MTRPLAIAVGDAAGVGPRVSIEAVARALGDDRVILFGDAARLLVGLASAGISAERIEAAADARGRVSVVDVGRISDTCVEAHAASPESGEASLRALDAAIDAVLVGHARGVCTGPVSKEAIVAAGHAFVGQTEHLARRTGLADDDVTMLFLGPKLRVGLVTTHLAISDAPAAIDVRRVQRTVRHLGEALVRVAPGKALRIDVVGLNPHAGEAGLFGREEIDVIGPACDALRNQSPFRGGPITLVGPRASEASFREAASGKVDGVVAMLHDQATIASKLLDWGNAVNVTWGLPFIRTSVDHGVAFDAARAGHADADGMVAALEMARVLTRDACS